jgi:hypothetical protein
MGIKISARKASISPHIEIVYNYTPNDRPKVLYLNMRQARELYLDLERAVEELIKER